MLVSGSSVLLSVSTNFLHYASGLTPGYVLSQRSRNRYHPVDTFVAMCLPFGSLRIISLYMLVKAFSGFHPFLFLLQRMEYMRCSLFLIFPYISAYHNHHMMNLSSIALIMSVLKCCSENDDCNAISSVFNCEVLEIVVFWIHLLEVKFLNVIPHTNGSIINSIACRYFT